MTAPPIPQLASPDVPTEVRSTTETVLVGLAVVLVGMGVKLPHGHLATLGDAVALLLAPVWLPAVRRYAGGFALVVVGTSAVVSGLVLTVLGLQDHEFSSGALLANNALLVGLVLSTGLICFARDRLGERAVVVLFGLGMLLGVDRHSQAYADEAWKFGYATGVSLVVLGLAYRRRGWQLVLLALLTLAASTTDSRSMFSILVLTAALVLWQWRPQPQQRTYRSSALRVALGLGLAAAVVYNVGTLLIVNGVLGESTQQRSLSQLHRSGSLLLGGRPEVAATLALVERPFGFGSGISPNHADITAAKAGMANINYDPNNGYVEKYMFGETYEVHSVVGDGWARYGLLGLLLFALVAFLVVRWLGVALSAGTASAAPLLLSITTGWNLAFSPIYAAIPVLVLTLAVVLLPSARGGPGASLGHDADPSPRTAP